MPLALLASAGWFSDWTADFTANQRFTLAIVSISLAAAVLISLVTVIAVMYRSIREREANIELTRELLADGKTPEEIERILKPADGFTRSLERFACNRRHAKDG